MGMGLRWTVAAVVVLLTAGCAGSGSSTASPRETVAVPSASAASASASASAPVVAPSAVTNAPSVATGAPPAAPGSPPRITVSRTGGFAGVEQRLVVRPDGEWAWTGADQGGGPGHGRLTEAQRAELARLAALPALAAEARAKGGAPGCADGFDYLLTVGSLSVSWMDCAPVTPPTAVAITDLLAAATPL
jgi:hypothetical protein